MMTMSVDKSLLEAGFSAAEMGVAKVRQMHARKYAGKFAAFSSFEANITNLMLDGKADGGMIEQEIGDLWTHLVVGDGRWETRASFSIMVTNIVLKVTSTTDKTNSKAAEELALWCLKGSGGGGSGGEGEGEGEGVGDGEAFEGLLSIMAHGDPKSAKDRKVESLTLSLSNW